MDDFLVADRFTDVSIKCQNQVFRCHRLVLAAASEYFDTMFDGRFKESHLEEIPLPDINCASFKEVLRFAYTGDVVITNNNVFNLLCGSEVLRINFIEGKCVQYLIEKNIPMHDALDIFLFACVTGKKSLIPTVSRFILNHLKYFSKDNKFFEIPFEEFTILLTYLQSSSLVMENLLLKTIVQWVCYWCDTPESRREKFNELTKCVSFQHISNKNCAKFFEKNFFHDVPPTSAVNAECNHVSLHAYISLESFNHSFIEDSDFKIECKTRLFTLQKNNDNIFNWYPQALQPAISRLRTVALEDRLYYLKLLENKFTFSMCPSVNLAADVQLLKEPSLSKHGQYSTYHLSTDGNNIYASFSYNSYNTVSNIFVYNCELDKWFQILKEKTLPELIMTCDNGQLYLIGGQNHGLDGRSRFVGAYDIRTGKCFNLTEFQPRNLNVTDNECCSHKEKIYISCASSSYLYDATYTDVIDVYNPMAGKWDTMINLKSHIVGSHRLLSYDNQLWVLGYTENESMCAQTYDSFSQESKIPLILDRVFEKHSSFGPLRLRLRGSIKDAIVFK